MNTEVNRPDGEIWILVHRDSGSRCSLDCVSSYRIPHLRGIMPYFASLSHKRLLNLINYLKDNILFYYY